ncbi:MAG: hypothetical protein IT279_12085 [Ignavibacteriaceae bacterium]|nr:hypothetical protein [Ignavibacteriaceae bacterium]
MFTQSEANYLLELPKLLTENDNYLRQKNYYPIMPIKERLYMASEQEPDFIFFLEIFQSSKNQLKLSLHCQEGETSIGLLRVDFNHDHPNPVEINEHVPELFKPYAGKTVKGSHIHYYVEGYRPLHWAIPLSVDNSFLIKQFADEAEIIDIIPAFNQKINLQTQFTINIQARLL